MDSKELMAGKLVAHMLENDIRALRTENAALKEQVAQLKSSVQHEADCVDSAAAEINRQAAENDKLKETIAQQEEAIRLKDALLSEIAKQIPEKPDYWSSCGQCERNAGDAEDALVIQASPEILQARDERVAKAIAKYLRAVGVLSYEGTALQGIISGEWRKYL